MRVGCGDSWVFMLVALLLLLLAGGRRMREEADDSDDGVSVTSVETRTTHASESGDFYDSFERNDEDEQALDEAVEELTEKRCVALGADSVDCK